MYPSSAGMATTPDAAASVSTTARPIRRSVIVRPFTPSTIAETTSAPWRDRPPARSFAFDTPAARWYEAAALIDGLRKDSMASFGTVGVDWQQRVNWDRAAHSTAGARRERMKAHNLGALLLMYDENVAT